MEDKMPTCPVCGWQTEEGNFRETYISSFNNQEYKLYHCNSCELEWWEPLKIIPEFYEQEGAEEYAMFHLGLREEIWENHKMFFKMIPVKSGRLLDVGCGDGVFLKEAKRAGYEVWGIDFDSKSIKVCQEKWGLKNTFVMTPFEFAEFCRKEGLKFDVITFFEVLEHQDKPREFLEAVKSMLKPGGWIAGSVPNRESWLYKKAYREVNSVVDNPPHHFLRFSQVAIKNVLEINSFNYYTVVVLDNLKDISSCLSLVLLGDTIIKKVKWAVLGCEYRGEGTSIYRDSNMVRKIVFKALKVLRNLGFFIPAVMVKPFTQGIGLYFQAQKASLGCHHV